MPLRALEPARMEDILCLWVRFCRFEKVLDPWARFGCVGISAYYSKVLDIGCFNALVFRCELGGYLFR